MTEFEITMSWEIEEGVEYPLRVTGRKEPVTPAYRRGHPERWTPAEGGELEDVKIFSRCRLPKDVERKLLNDDAFVRAVEAEIQFRRNR